MATIVGVVGPWSTDDALPARRNAWHARSPCTAGKIAEGAAPRMAGFDQSLREHQTGDLANSTLVLHGWPKSPYRSRSHEIRASLALQFMKAKTETSSRLR